MGMHITLHDALNSSDKMQNHKNSGFFARTKITAGYDPYIDSRSGTTKFGTPIFETENMIVMGGSLFTLEKLFNINYFSEGNNTIDDGLIYDPLLFGGTVSREGFPQKDNVICLFGVSTEGAGESITDVKDVNYYERTMFEGGAGSNYGLIPFQVLSTGEAFTPTEEGKYWYRKQISINDTTKTAFYLKSFENAPKIHILYRDNGDDDGTAVTQSPWLSVPSTPIETFVELTLKITKTDVRQYFIDNGDTEKTRINSIALFSGIKKEVTLNGSTYPDYREVRMFSKLNINNEMLTANKDLTISYRIYTS